MRQMKLVWIALLASFAVAAIAATAAQAENPQALKLGGGSPTFPIKVTSTTAAGVKPILETALGTITCEKDKTLGGEITSLTLGVAGIDFENCEQTPSKEKCTTTGDATGVILLPSTSVHLVAYKTNTELLAGLLFLAVSIEFTCGALKVKVQGNVIGLLGPLNVDSTDFTLLFDRVGTSFIQKPTSCEVPIAVCLPGGKTALYSLLANLGAGLEHAIQIVKQLITTATDLLIDA